MRPDATRRWCRPTLQRAASVRREDTACEDNLPPSPVDLCDTAALVVCIAPASHGWPFFWGNLALLPTALRASAEPADCDAA